MSEEDQMLRAIAMSLGENVLVSTNQVLHKYFVFVHKIFSEIICNNKHILTYIPI